jgi:hypothetical protein
VSTVFDVSGDNLFVDTVMRSAVGPAGYAGVGGALCMTIAVPMMMAAPVAPIPMITPIIRSRLRRGVVLTACEAGAGAARNAAPILAVTPAGTSGAEEASVPSRARAREICSSPLLIAQ